MYDKYTISYGEKERGLRQINRFKPLSFFTGVFYNEKWNVLILLLRFWRWNVNHENAIGNRQDMDGMEKRKEFG